MVMVTIPSIIPILVHNNSKFIGELINNVGAIIT